MNRFIHVNTIIWSIVVITLSFLFYDKISFKKETTVTTQLPEIIVATAQTVNKQTAKPKKQEQIVLTKEQLRLANTIKKIYRRPSLFEIKRVVYSVAKHAKRNNIDPKLAIAIIATESGFNRHAVSSEGASGYAQVIPKYHRKFIKGRDIFDTEVNIEVGMKILSECIHKYKSTYLGLACYNGTNDIEKIEHYIAQIEKRKEQFT